jgi:hypothetical protein
VGNEHVRSSKRHSRLRVQASRLADRLTSKSFSRDGIVENYGLESEVLCVSKLGCARIIPSGGEKILREEIERFLADGCVETQLCAATEVVVTDFAG